MGTDGRAGHLQVGGEPERGDAARNRRKLLDAARRLMADRDPGEVTTDEIAAAAGVGKGTLFRRFGSRSGLMIALLDQDEQSMQQAFLFGPPPLGPGAPPLERLLAFGRERSRFVEAHREILGQVNRDPAARYNAVFALMHTHIRMLLSAADSTGDLDAQAAALLALLDADYISYRVGTGGENPESLDILASLVRSWETLAVKLCGR